MTHAMRAGVLVLAAGVVACAPCGPFDEIDVEGGSAGARARVQEALADFSAWTGRDAVCVNRVEIVDAIDPDSHLESLGRYRSGPRLIQVLSPQANLYDTVIHELCHAVDHEEGITRRHRSTFRYDPAATDYDHRTVRSRQREGMALACEAGPEALAIAATVAPRCRPGLDIDFVHVVLDEVYTPMPSVVEPGPSLVEHPVASWDIPDGWSLFGATPVASNHAGDLLLQMRIGDDLVVLALDAYTGDFLGSPVGQAAVLHRAPPPPASTYLWEGTQTARWSDGHQLTSFRWRLASGDEIRPLMYHDGERWLAPDAPCASPDSWVVEVDREPWIITQDREVLRWSRLERE